MATIKESSTKYDQVRRDIAALAERYPERRRAPSAKSSIYLHNVLVGSGVSSMSLSFLDEKLLKAFDVGLVSKELVIEGLEGKYTINVEDIKIEYGTGPYGTTIDITGEVIP